MAVDDQQYNLLARDTAHDHINTYMQLSVSAEVKTDISINGKKLARNFQNFAPFPVDSTQLLSDVCATRRSQKSDSPVSKNY